MKKIIYPIIALITLLVVFGACSGDSYQKKIDKEKKAFKNFLSDNRITTIHEYPEGHVFKENEYYLEPGTGVYMRVIDPGDVSKSLVDRDEKPTVAIRFDSVFFMVSDYYTKGNNNNNHNVVSFKFGDPNTYLSTNEYNINWSFMSPACVLPLQKGVGPGAEVSLIVPFINGSTYQSSYYEPFYYPSLKYNYFLQE